MNDKKRVSLRFNFKCPDCGSSFFGTSGCTGDNPKGHCHNTLGQCKFTWDRNTQDEDVFTGIKR